MGEKRAKSGDKTTAAAKAALNKLQSLADVTLKKMSADALPLLVLFSDRPGTLSD